MQLFQRRLWVGLVFFSMLSTTTVHADPPADHPAANQPAQAAPATDEWIATLPSGATVELVGVSNHPLDDAGWWAPDGSPMSPAPQNLITAKMYRGSSRPMDWPWKADARLYKFFVRYDTPDGGQRVMSPRVEGDQARGAHRAVGQEHFFLECVMPVPADAKTATIRIELGMSGVEKLIDTDSVMTPADIVVPETGNKKVIFRPRTTADGQYAVTIDCPTDLLADDFVRPVVTSMGKDILHHSSTAREHPVDGVTRLNYTMEVKTQDVDRFRFEVYRPAEYGRFTQVSLEKSTRTVPTAEGRRGDRWPKNIQAR